MLTHTLNIVLLSKLPCCESSSSKENCFNHLPPRIIVVAWIWESSGKTLTENRTVLPFAFMIRVYSRSNVVLYVTVSARKLKKLVHMLPFHVLTRYQKFDYECYHEIPVKNTHTWNVRSLARADTLFARIMRTTKPADCCRLPASLFAGSSDLPCDVYSKWWSLPCMWLVVFGFLSFFWISILSKVVCPLLELFVILSVENSHNWTFLFPPSGLKVPFTEAPTNLTYVALGSVARLKWNFLIHGRFRRAEIQCKRGGTFKTLAVKEEDGTIQTNPLEPDSITKRITIEGNATLVISGVKAEDITEYKCVLVYLNTSTVQGGVTQLILTGEEQIHTMYMFRLVQWWLL